MIAFATAALMLYATAMPTRTLNGSLVDIGANVLERMINNSYYHPHSDDKVKCSGLLVYAIHHI